MKIDPTKNAWYRPEYGNADADGAVYPGIWNVGDHDGGDDAAHHGADLAQL